MAGAASLGTNPLLNVLIGLGVVTVVLLRRTDDPWARTVAAYLGLAVFIVALRLLFAVVAGAPIGTTVLFSLPQLDLPDWAAGIRIGGPVTAEGLAYTAYDSIRLAVMLICLGGANALANPRRALKSVPAALYEASVAIVIALSVAPQLIESTARVRRAQRLRGGAGSGWSAVAAVVTPVLSDAVDRSLRLAAGMESRGFGRTRQGARPPATLTATLLLSALLATLGGFWLLAGTGSVDRIVAAALLTFGVLGVGAGLRHSGRRLAVTRYRPEPWTPRDTALAASGLLALATAAVLSSTALPDAFAAMHPSTDPLEWPRLLPAMGLILAGVLAPLALTTDPTPRR